MSFADQIQKFNKNKLATTHPIITNKSGFKFQEVRNTDGTVSQVALDQKSVGFVIDTAPDAKLHQVIQKLFIGSQDAAANFSLLKENEVSHILNVASGVESAFPENFVYKKVEILDLPEVQIIDYFPVCFEFINEAIIKGSGILIHCNAGISRSASIIIGYLMYSQSLKYDQALELVKIARPQVRPNDGFVTQLRAYKYTK